MNGSCEGGEEWVREGEGAVPIHSAPNTNSFRPLPLPLNQVSSLSPRCPHIYYIWKLPGDHETPDAHRKQKACYVAAQREAKVFTSAAHFNYIKEMTGSVAAMSRRSMIVVYEELTGMQVPTQRKGERCVFVCASVPLSCVSQRVSSPLTRALLSVF